MLRADGRAYITAWVPAGPIDAMVTVLGRAVGQATGAPQRTLPTDTQPVWPTARTTRFFEIGAAVAAGEKISGAIDTQKAASTRIAAPRRRPIALMGSVLRVT